MRSTPARLAFVVLLTAACFALWSWPLPLHLSTHTVVLEVTPMEDPQAPKGQGGWELILANDQNLSLWGAVQNARALLGGDLSDLLSQRQCFPMPDSAALGEHMIEAGILAVPGLVVSGDPVIAFNVSLVVALVIGALGMALFLLRHTGSWPAAVAGAIAFACSTPHLSDLSYHPAVVGVHWIPWVLLFFDRVLDGQRTGAMIGLAVTLLMATLVGSYPLVAVALVAGLYGIARVAERWRRGELSAAALLGVALSVLPAAVTAVAILSFYSAVQQDWVLVTSAGAKALLDPADFLPGGRSSPGLFAMTGLVLLLALRGERSVAVRALVVAAAVTALVAVRIPVGDTGWNLYEWLAQRFSFLDTIRGPAKVGLGTCFTVQALGAIGWSRAMLRVGSTGGAMMAAVLVAVTVVEMSPPPFARPLLGSGATMKLRAVAPPSEIVAALRSTLAHAGDRRAVFDLPAGRMVRSPIALVDAAYHGHATSACYNSLIPPTMRATFDLAARSHGADGVAELAAAGFGYVIERRSGNAAALSSNSFRPPARLLSFEKDHAIWALPEAPSLHHDVSLLELVAVGGATRASAFAPESPHELDVKVTNRGLVVWTPAQPLEAWKASVELIPHGGETVFRARARGMLPLALAAGASTTVPLMLTDAPAAGRYEARITFDGMEKVLGAKDFNWKDQRH